MQANQTDRTSHCLWHRPPYRSHGNYTKTSSGTLATVSGAASDGHTKFKITLTDLSGKKGVAYAIVSYDQTVPILTLENSSNENWTNQDVTLVANHSDETSPIAAVITLF